jgi:ATP-binding cassette subfamily F protein uup
VPLLSLRGVSLAYGHLPLLAQVEFSIEPGERICLVGRNGTGKSTLFRVISGNAVPDDGEVWRRDPLRIAHLEQEVPADSTATVYDVVADGLGEVGALLKDYHHAALEAGSNPRALEQLHQLQARIETLDGWNLGQKVDTVISKLDVPADRRLDECSGGLRRRVMLARALVSEPDLLLLDEPTNHMDIAAITWLEEYLLSWQGALIFITHDRTFLRNLATRIIELDRGVLSSFPGDFDRYLQKKAEMLEAEGRANARFDKKLAEEEAWIRKGIQARRTRNEGRVRQLLAMRKARAKRLEQQGKVSLNLNEGEESGKRVVDLRKVSFRYGDHVIIRDLTTRIMRGDRIGIIGPNGSGKSTLLRIILGELQPTSGEVIMGTRLELGYFDQYRTQLDISKTVRENISEGSDYINVRGRPRHVIGYLRDFLFPPQRIDSPVKSLSGGERNRLLLAKLFTRPANMMVLDEPTNDLDVDTLELLEELLTEYDGTLLLVSHDRAFLDNVVTSTLVFEGDGHVGEYVGGYEDWLRQRGARPAAGLTQEPAAPARTQDAVGAQPAKKKLSYNEQRELDALPKTIESLEAELTAAERQMADPGFYQLERQLISDTAARAASLREELDTAYARWEALDTRD